MIDRLKMTNDNMFIAGFVMERQWCLTYDTKDKLNQRINMPDWRLFYQRHLNFHQKRIQNYNSLTLKKWTYKFLCIYVNTYGRFMFEIKNHYHYSFYSINYLKIAYKHFLRKNITYCWNMSIYSDCWWTKYTMY